MNKIFPKLTGTGRGAGGGLPSIKSAIVGNAGDSPPGPKRSGPLFPPLLLLFFLSKHDIPLSQSNLFLISNSFPGWLGKDLIKSLSDCFFFLSISLRRLPTTGFSASNVEMSSNTSSKGFYFLKIFLLIGSTFCLKLASFILSLVT